MVPDHIRRNEKDDTLKAGTEPKKVPLIPHVYAPLHMRRQNRWAHIYSRGGNEEKQQSDKNEWIYQQSKVIYSAYFPFIRVITSLPGKKVPVIGSSGPECHLCPDRDESAEPCQIPVLVHSGDAGTLHGPASWNGFSLPRFRIYGRK